MATLESASLDGVAYPTSLHSREHPAMSEREIAMQPRAPTREIQKIMDGGDPGGVISKRARKAAKPLSRDVRLARLTGRPPAAMPQLDHITLSVHDWRASRDWWTRHLGFEVEFEFPGGVAVRDAGNMTVFLAEGRVLPAPEIAFTVRVNDVEAQHAAMTADGVAFSHPPQKVYWGYGAEVIDPNGYRIRLWDEASMAEKGATRAPRKSKK